MSSAVDPVVVSEAARERLRKFHDDKDDVEDEEGEEPSLRDLAEKLDH